MEYFFIVQTSIFQVHSRLKFSILNSVNLCVRLTAEKYTKKAEYIFTDFLKRNSEFWKFESYIDNYIKTSIFYFIFF